MHLQKQYWITCFLLFTFLSANAQSRLADLVVKSSGKGEKIIVYLDGEAINSTPQDEVILRGATKGIHELRVQLFFPTGLTQQLVNTIALEEGMAHFYQVKQRPSGDFVVRFFDVTPRLSPPPENMPPPPTAGVNVNINVDVHDDHGHQQGPPSGNIPPPPPPDGYTGRTGCPYPITDNEFMQIKSVIASKDFESTKAQIAKQIIRSKCLRARHVQDLLSLFDFESTKLDFAKFAFDFTYDQDNYYLVHSAFDFEASVNELSEYIQTRY